MKHYFDCAGKPLDLSKPRVMGILNVTPDSFSDGGQFHSFDHAIDHAFEMIEQGADIIDIGGESTRPNAAKVSVQEELDRVLPVIEKLAPDVSIPISIDTYKAIVMTEAVNAGAGMINDVKALTDNGAMDAAAALDVPICLMHMQGQPDNMQQAPHYEDVVSEVYRFLQQRIASCAFSGIDQDRLMVDPGFGFGKTLKHNLQLLKSFRYFQSLGVPVLAGMSRKRMLSEMLGGVEPHQRLYAGIAASMLALQGGAAILRVHDVKASADALCVFQAIHDV